MNTSRLTRLTLDDVWIFAAVAFVILRVLLTPVPPNDFWWHMATGRELITTGRLPVVDSFSFTRAGEPFYNQSWLAQLVMLGLYQAGGIPLLIVVQAAVIGLAYGLLLRLCIARSGATRLSAGVLMLLTMPASFDNWIIRPQSYALLLFMVFLYVLSRWREPGFAAQSTGFRKALWLLPPLAAIWVNLHGSFVLGGALIGLTFVGEGLRRFVTDRREERAWATRPVSGPEATMLSHPAQPKRPPLTDLIFCGLAVGAAWLLNPGGLAVLGYVRNLLSSSAVTQLVTEWAPPTIRNPGGIIFFLFVIIAIVALAYARKQPNLVDVLIAGAFLWLALGAVRNNIWFSAVATPLIVLQFAAWREAAPTASRSPGLPSANAALIGVIGLMVVLALPWLKPVLGLPPELGALETPQTPVAAVAFIQTEAEADRPQRLFSEMGFSSYLIWALPTQKVFVDPRIELYPLEQWQDYIRLGGGREPETLLTKYAIDGALLDPQSQERLIDYLRVASDWQLRYEDDHAVYFVKGDG